MNRRADIQTDRSIQTDEQTGRQINTYRYTDGLESFSQLLAAHLQTEAMLAMLGIKVNESFHPLRRLTEDVGSVCVCVCVCVCVIHMHYQNMEMPKCES